MPQAIEAFNVEGGYTIIEMLLKTTLHIYTHIRMYRNLTFFD
jgi:hypothetical protein